MSRTAKTTKTLCLLALLTLPAVPVGAQPTTPVVLDGLSEAEALKRVRAARPAQVFTAQGRKFTAAELLRDFDRRTAARRRRQESAMATGASSVPDPRRTAALANAQLKADRESKSREVEGLARRLGACLAVPFDTPEARRRAAEAEKILRAWESSTPREKVLLSERAEALLKQIE